MNLRKNLGLFALTLVISAGAMASTLIPVWSEANIEDTGSVCLQAGGKVIGRSMETTTAKDNQFYIVVCKRPTDETSQTFTYVPAWSALNGDNAIARCGTKSVTTGLGAGTAIGKPVSVETNTPDIFIAICEIN